MQFLQTDPGYIHGLCKECDPETVIKIPVTILSALVENDQGHLDLTAKVEKIDLQPMYDHKLMEHGPSFE